jgi:glycerol-3-phosphate acyltransferase PlsY
VLAIILLVPIAYLLGTFPSAVMIARGRGVDITTSGSGNPGASNVGRLLGRKLGVLVFVLDGLKGAISVAIGFWIAGYAGALALACAAVVGHVFPITRGFKGGKGVATAGGSVIALYPIIGAAMTVLWLITAKLTKKASLGSLAIAVGFPVSQVIAGRPWGEVLTGFGLCAFVIWRHLPNLKRLVHGDELNLKKSTPPT